MKKMNWLGLILALVMCLAMVPAQAETYTAEEIKYDSVSSPYSNDELFAAYVEREMYRPIYGDTSAFGVLAKDKLDTDAKKEMYDALKTMIEEIAKGNRDSTVISFDAEALKGFHGLKTNFEAAELGLSSLGSDDEFTQEAKTKAMKAFSAQLLDGLLEALLHDCPYDLYWFDKAVDGAMSMGFQFIGTSQNIQVTRCVISFQVANGYGSDTTVDITKTNAAADAIKNAQAIVDKHASKSDLEKLDAYRQEICDLVSYNHAAAKDDYTGGYGDPWQLIWVFDGNPSTNVVCEGYAKAFQYLCDLTKFDEKVYCYSVSGTMIGGTGAGPHMWNIVQTDDGNYLVDVTNCDEGTVGEIKELFMKAQATGAWNTQYELTPNGQTITYIYDDDVIAMWGEEVLKLGENHTHDWKVNKAEWRLSNKIPTSCQKTRYCECGETETASTDSITSVVEKKATCAEKGQVKYTATFAEDWAVSEPYVVEPEKDLNNHTGETELSGKGDATCSQNGYTGDVLCKGCGATLVQGNTIPFTGVHNYTLEVPGTRTDATCMAKGSVTKKCSGCTATEVQTLPIDPANHTKRNTTVDDAVDATCGAEGYTGNTYCECGGKIETGQTLPATGAHVYGNPEYEWADDFSACTATGSCSGCDAEVTISAAISENTTAPTCGADGKKVVTATFADTWASQQIKEITLPATGEHAYGDVTYDWADDFITCKASRACGCGRTEEVKANVSFETTKDATCAAEGERTYTATFDKDWTTTQIKKEPLAKNDENHEGETEVRDAVTVTCSEDGYTGDTYCLGCGNMIEKGKAIPATGEHVYVNPVYDWADDFSSCTATAACGCSKTAEETVVTAFTSKKATCAETGEILYTADFEAKWADTQTKTKSIEKDPANHTGDTELRDIKDATCSKDGYTGNTYCRGCNEKLKEGETTSATGEHVYRKEVEGTRVDATCMAEGSVTMQCNGCDATEDQTLQKDAFKHTGNTITKKAADPTCGAEGYTGDIYCECDIPLTMGQTIPATGDHKYNVEVEDSRVAATCKDTGSVIMKCEKCTATEEQTLPVDPANHTGETELRGKVDATCATPGYTGDTHCKGCGEKLKDGETTSATGEHNYVDITYTWETDFSACEATRSCGCGASETADATVNSEITTPATCAAKGKKTYTATFDKEWAQPQTKTETIAEDAANHTGETEVRDGKDATCAEDGYTGDTYCLGCNEKLADGEDIPATGEHSYTVEVEDTRIPATCKTPGKVTMQCSGCDATEEQTLPLDPENHEGETEVRGASPATCTENGYTGDTCCLACGGVIAEGEIIPAGHVDEDRDGVCDNCPTVLAFSITIMPSEGGAVSISGDEAAAGDEVIITLMPDAGMEMEAVLVRLEDGTTITPHLVAGNRYAYTQPAGDVTVEAFFKAIPVTKYMVTFHATEGFGVMLPVQVAAGQAYTLPECSFIPAEGYTFKGWALTADGPVLPQTVTVGGNIDLYAVWQPLYNVSPIIPMPPTTGDSANLALWAVLMALSAAGVIWLLKPRKHKA